jgi:hypothetical protein
LAGACRHNEKIRQFAGQAEILTFRVNPSRYLNKIYASTVLAFLESGFCQTIVLLVQCKLILKKMKFILSFPLSGFKKLTSFCNH